MPRRGDSTARHSQTLPNRPQLLARHAESPARRSASFPRRSETLANRPLCRADRPEAVAESAERDARGRDTGPADGESFPVVSDGLLRSQAISSAIGGESRVFRRVAAGSLFGPGRFAEVMIENRGAGGSIPPLGTTPVDPGHKLRGGSWMGLGTVVRPGAVQGPHGEGGGGATGQRGRSASPADGRGSEASDCPAVFFGRFGGRGQVFSVRQDIGEPGGLRLSCRPYGRENRPALLRRRIYPTSLQTGKNSGGGHEIRRAPTGGSGGRNREWEEGEAPFEILDMSV
jgi:hypothetical protein